RRPPRTPLCPYTTLFRSVVTILSTILLLRDLIVGRDNIGFSLQIVLWLWFTLLFANFAEAVAEGRGKAQADALRRTRTQTDAKLDRKSTRLNSSHVKISY